MIIEVLGNVPLLTTFAAEFIRINDVFRYTEAQRNSRTINSNKTSDCE